MAKFVCEPVKYKQRYRWRRSMVKEPTYYYDIVWTTGATHRLDISIVSVPERGYFISNFNHANTAIDWKYDFGPYPDLPTAKSIAETFIALNQRVPRNRVRRRKL